MNKEQMSSLHVDALSALAGGSTTNCQGCGKQVGGLIEFSQFIGLKPQIVERVIVDTGEKIKEKVSLPFYGASVMLCYPCFRLAVKIEKRKSFRETLCHRSSI
jgi:hypothetical protein